MLGSALPLDARPEHTAYRPGEEVAVLVDASAEGSVELRLTHLGDLVAERRVDVTTGRTRISLGDLPTGAYAVRLAAAAGTACTAVEVLEHPLSRPRYGFVSDFAPGRADLPTLAALTDSLRAFHLNVVQFYDWMYRHAQLLPPGDVRTATAPDEFDDALGRRLSLRTVRGLVHAVHAAGAQALGYAAVYGAGVDYAEAHPDQVLHHRDGTPWGLAGFLTIMDVTPGSPWVEHIVGQASAAVSAVPFDGLHLDQYGSPQVALTAAGETVDLAQALPALVDAVRDAIPDATLIFNNVNDFPTARSAHARQDVTYIEVWSPHDTHADLVDLVGRARGVAPQRPVVLAAYLEPFATAGGPAEVAAATLALATVWAAGGQYLLFGEVGAVLCDPYYVRHAVLSAEARTELRRFVDFSVANGDLLFDTSALETTSSMAGGINEDVVVTGAPVSLRPQAGSVWLRTSAVGSRLLVQLVDFRGQEDGRWNAPRSPVQPATGVRLRLRVVARHPRVRFGHPGAGTELVDLPVTDDLGDDVVVDLPEFTTWALILVDR